MFFLRLYEWFTTAEVIPKWKKWGLLISWWIAGIIIGACGVLWHWAR